MNDHADVIRAAVERRFAQVARRAGWAKKLSLGRAKGVDCAPQERDAVAHNSPGIARRGLP
jgi:hypothetical protein